EVPAQSAALRRRRSGAAVPQVVQAVLSRAGKFDEDLRPGSAAGTGGCARRSRFFVESMRMAVVRVIGRDGGTQDLDIVDGGQLMDALRDAGTGVQGTCGGMMSCGTCHVYVDPAWAGRLPTGSEDEVAMLEAIGELV